MKQIKFIDLENNEIHGGILLETGDCICGCCGGIQEADDCGITWQILEKYDTWINLDDEIIGN